MEMPNNIKIDFKYYCKDCRRCDPYIQTIHPDFRVRGRKGDLESFILGCRHEDSCEELSERLEKISCVISGDTLEIRSGSSDEKNSKLL